MNVLEDYNPANAGALTQEQQAAMMSLTDQDIKALAEKYPNTSTNNNYLLLYDKRLAADKQLYQVSSWQNLHDLLSYGQKHFAPYAFRGDLKKTAGVAAAAAAASVSNPLVPAKANIDLSELEANQAAGINAKNSSLQPAEQENTPGLTSFIATALPAADNTAGPAYTTGGNINVPESGNTGNVIDTIPITNPTEQAAPAVVTGQDAGNTGTVALGAVAGNYMPAVTQEQANTPVVPPAAPTIKPAPAGNENKPGKNKPGNTGANKVNEQ